MSKSKPHKSFLMTPIKNKMRSRIYYDGCILVETREKSVLDIYRFKEYGVSGEYGGWKTPWVTETGLTGF
jgi:hypothetical protein